LAEDKESKTEEPTAKKLEDTRKKGRTAKSQEINTVLVLLVSVVFFVFLGMYTVRNLLMLWHDYFSISSEFHLTSESAHFLLKNTFIQLFFITMPFMGVLALVGVASNYWQNDGWLFSWDPLSPKFNKLNPLQGFKKFLGKEGAMNLLKSLGKLSLIGTAVYLAFDDEMEMIPVLLESTVVQTLRILGWETFDLIMKVLLVMAIIALIDYVYQKYAFLESLKMTKQEVKDERKDIDGDPFIKSRMKQKQFEMFRNRMMGKVPEAEVIITNPTHLSIALRYNRLTDPAPVVVAKGSGYVALKIREVAKEHNIPVVEDKPLARTLYKSVDIGDLIPETLYKAVAETLAYVYKLKGKAL